MTSLLCLPDELLVKVILHLSPDDINNLYAFHPIANRLKNFITLTKDTHDTKFFFNIPSESHIYWDDNKTLQNHEMIKLFEISYIENYTGSISHTYQNVFAKFIVFVGDSHDIEDYMYEETNDLLEMHPINPKNFNYLLFDTISDVLSLGGINDIIRSPGNYHFKKVQNVNIFDMKIINQDEKIKFERIGDLTINSVSLPPMPIINIFNFDQYIVAKCFIYIEVEALDFSFYKFTNIKLLTIRLEDYEVYPEDDPLYHLSMKNCNFSQLQVLEIKASHGVIQDCEFPHLKLLKIEQSLEFDHRRFEFKNVKFPELIYFEWDSEEKSPIIQQDVELPKLRLLELRVGSRFNPVIDLLGEHLMDYYTGRNPRFHDVYETDYCYCDVVGKMNLIKQKFPEGLYVILAVLKAIESKKLDQLTFIAIEVNYLLDSKDLSNFTFKKLKKAEVIISEDLKSMVKMFEAPLLEQLVLKYKRGDIFDSELIEHFKNLKELVLMYDTDEDIEIQAEKLPNQIEKLLIKSRPFCKISITGEFKNLKSLRIEKHNKSAKSQMNTSHHPEADPNVITLNLSAPKLIEIKLSGVGFNLLKLHNCPLLEIITGKCVSRINFLESLPSLTKFSIEETKYTEEIIAKAPSKLKVHYEYGLEAKESQLIIGVVDDVQNLQNKTKHWYEEEPDKFLIKTFKDELLEKLKNETSWYEPSKRWYFDDNGKIVWDPCGDCTLRKDISQFESQLNTAPLSLQGSIVANLSTLTKTIDEYESLAKNESQPEKQEKARIRLINFKKDIQELRTKYQNLKKTRDDQLEETTRSELLNRRGHYNGQSSITSSSSANPFDSQQGTQQQPQQQQSYHDGLYKENSTLSRGNQQLDEILEMGMEAFDELVASNELIRKFQSKVTDSLSTLGVSQGTIRTIEKRAFEDKWLFYGGAILMFIILYYIYKWLG
ncbi:hypothetical protein BN7_1988 [Wickerhamomyces ciferrii]|uniref:F-box domain-containing protein n=1 Tax=Wickerhamomyces ciferrii (strain ATCC 14091 / BCRC 22168 / CBS 111 / JCM 3599 / NBRC 0793 / NRRL Y-1031 F-60-10) TaxID=1206466 RepID=K0KMU0_WICCF|nr:uncharacterized protein BN7_1988 [Wickerhamomyces ciferrii]CCH42443.1 hypothetical protein BN7_1988 [Wickerhamomyces ciferrii]